MRETKIEFVADPIEKADWWELGMKNTPQAGTAFPAWVWNLPPEPVNWSPDLLKKASAAKSHKNKAATLYTSQKTKQNV